MIHKHYNFPLTLAPMVGLSHVALRELIYSYLPEGAKTFWPTEMLNSRRLPYQKLGETPETKKHPRDEYLVPQLLANEESFIRDSVIKLKDWGAVGIDINMGCPVKKALKHNYGVSLMGDRKYASEVVKHTVAASDLPVSVKVRAGIKNDPQYLKDFLLSIQDAGASYISLHPRLAEEKRRGRADWELIAYVKSFLDIPVVGNGDIQTAQDIDEMFQVGKCDAVMIGRALNARPWLFWQWGEANDYLAPADRQGEKAPNTPEEEAKEYSLAMMRLLDYLLLYYPETLAMKRFCFHIKANYMWISYGQRLFGLVQKSKDINSLKQNWNHFFSHRIVMYPKSDLRY